MHAITSQSHYCLHCPGTKNKYKCQEAGVDHDTICLACWHGQRHLTTEDEFHVLCTCPKYEQARNSFLSSLPLGLTLDNTHDVIRIFSGASPSVIIALGVFLSRIRQIRRRLKLRFEQCNKQLESTSFHVKRAAWKWKRRPTCRHGILFSQLPPGGCQCMGLHSDDSVWKFACYMPALNSELKTIVAVPFDRDNFVHLAVLQHKARRLGW